MSTATTYPPATIPKLIPAARYFTRLWSLESPTSRFEKKFLRKRIQDLNNLNRIILQDLVWTCWMKVSDTDYKKKRWARITNRNWFGELSVELSQPKRKRIYVCKTSNLDRQVFSLTFKICEEKRTEQNTHHPTIQWWCICSVLKLHYWSQPTFQHHIGPWTLL